MVSVDFIKTQLSVKCTKITDCRGNTENLVGLCLTTTQITDFGFYECKGCRCYGCKTCSEGRCKGKCPVWGVCCSGTLNHENCVMRYGWYNVPKFIVIGMVCCQNDFVCATPSRMDDSTIKQFIDYFEDRGVNVCMEILPKECKCS